jgi:hypothetical protein
MNHINYFTLTFQAHGVITANIGSYVKSIEIYGCTIRAMCCMSVFVEHDDRRSCCSSVSIATGYGLECQVRFMAGVRFFCSP